MQTRVREDGIKDERRDTGNIDIRLVHAQLARPVNGRVDPQPPHSSVLF